MATTLATGANWLATSRQLVAIVWQLVANQSSDAYLNMKTGIFSQIQDLAVPASLVSSLTTICKQGRLRLCTYVFLCRVYWMQGLSKGDKRL